MVKKIIDILRFLPVILALTIWSGLPAANAQAISEDPAVALQPDGAAPAQARSGRKINVYVFGDSLANDLWRGLKQAFKRDPSVSLIKKSRSSTGFVRTDYYDWPAELEKILESEPMDMALVLIGAGDRQRMRKSDGRHRFGTPEFREIYAGRVDTFMQQMVQRRIPVYWLGLPIVKGPNYRAALTELNDLYKQRAEANGVTFIPTWDHFAKAGGKWTSYGKNIAGTVQRLRKNDGLHFTPAGRRILATFVEQPIRDFLASGPVYEGESVIAAPTIGDALDADGSQTGIGNNGDPLQEVVFDIGAERSDASLRKILTEVDAKADAKRKADFRSSSPAYKVLTLGHAVEPKPGRGDDFTWSE